MLCQDVYIFIVIFPRSPPMNFAHHNHYVPQWYQKRFLAPGRVEDKLHYLDLAPERVNHPNGGFHYRDALRRLGPTNCFAQDDLYTLNFGNQASDIIETRFFGVIDGKGSTAVEFFSDYAFKNGAGDAYQNLMRYMDAQKLRTPKGLDFLRKLSKTDDNQVALHVMGELHQMHITIWSEGVWEVLACDESPTKFIVSDHPVTTYNKGEFPGSRACTYPLDSRIDLLGTHTIFPLDLNRCLVITNLGYVRNPNASPTRTRENPRYYAAPTMFDLRKVQTGRQVSEDYVRAINYVLKTRAKRYIAAGEREWLYPEKGLAATRWDRLGDKVFLMPDPRKVNFTTGFVMGFKGGGGWGHDEYGRHSDDNDPEVKRLREKEWRTFQAAKQSWDSMFGELTDEEWRKYV